MSLREQNKREKLERIRIAASELFERQGFAGTTGRQICDRAGIGTGTLFLYVKDKRELLMLVFEREVRRLYREGLHRAEQATTLTDALMALFAGFFEFYAARPELALEILQELLFRELGPERSGGLSLEFLQHVEDLIRSAMARGELRPDIDPSTAAVACFAQYSFWVPAWLGAGLVDRKEAEARLRAGLELLVKGLGANSRIDHGPKQKESR
ncbi:MAG: TetR/AcrR family transcriptional regulator [bacterium]|nr:TetR/AcrR family transcriptional regulator [bacterium]MCP5066082.1 TetR/AcrR family transcriptional regulator [bacterium]